jgi:hypothetical protein
MAQYDINLPPNGAQTLDVSGSFFTYKGGIGPIRVTPSSGEPVDLLPGQGMSGLKFDRLTVKDLSGANNVGVLLAGNGAWRDERITGTVDVVDGGKARTLAGSAYSIAFGSGQAAGVYSRVALFNPPDSGKYLIVESLAMSADVANSVNLHRGTAQLSGAVKPGMRKLINQLAQSSAATVSQDTAASTRPTEEAIWQLAVAPGAKDTWAPKEPLIVTPGSSLLYACNLMNVGFAASIEWFEEKI